ncbi:hypothetical protein HHI36_008596 [Cryptolaemus montrouzieri]|uniref:Uncharacterized protein n=1 Tax=Cryptolaemus montrouzieri TaxID=559131 RepID=A0ABD2MSZ4_9CUCU
MCHFTNNLDLHLTKFWDIEERQVERHFNNEEKACGVLKRTSLTTATNKGVSLNNALMVDPTLQADPIKLLIRFRKFQVAITCDIEENVQRISCSRTKPKISKVSLVQLRTQATQTLE